ncbi:hypothetical protein ACEN88_00555 [Massilia sp. CT11-108]|uniref:hypothetical protein n=1 Tax=Massilia sp. CT11-108 TaxID=3393900 RepID=UPI0039A459F6
MNETKFTSKIGGATSPEEKKAVLSPEYAGRIESPYGVQYINRDEAVDHAHMRARQLSSLLLLIQGDNAEGFRGLGLGAQDSLLWMAVQMADELKDMVDIVAADAQEDQV